MFPLKDNMPTDRTAVVTLALIALNIVVYFVLQRGGILSGPDDTITVEWGAIPYEFWNLGRECDLIASTGQVACEGQPGVTGAAGDQPPTLLTALSSMFMHGGILHLGGNMLFLWIFGNNIEDSMGRGRFVLFYLLGGAAALVAQAVVDPNATSPMIGASGAVAGVLGGYVVLYPRARVVTLVFIIIFFTVIELPAMLMLGLWFAQQLLFGALDLTGPGGGGVAYFAHIGGFVLGAALIRAFAVRVKETPPRLPVR